LLAAVESCAPIAGVNSVDEMWIRLTGRDRERTNAVSLARQIKAAIARAGSTIKCSIGIAPNEFLAKTASDMKKPDGLVIIEQRDLPDALLPLKLTDFVGIGKKMHDRLLRNGIGHTQALLQADLKTLRQIWGGVEGERMWAKLRGEDIERTPTQKASISHSHVLAPHLRTMLAARSVLSRLTQKAAMRLRHYGYVSGSVTVHLKLRDGQKWDAHLPLSPTDDTRLLLTAVDTLYAQALSLESIRAGSPVQVGMGLGALSPARGATRDLFDTAIPVAAPNDPASTYGATLLSKSPVAREQLDRSLDALNLKYGKNTVYFGGAHKALHAAPMRIAFNHIPDLVIESDENKQTDLDLRKVVTTRKSV
jgi:DNA polymerase-4